MNRSDSPKLTYLTLLFEAVGIAFHSDSKLTMDQYGEIITAYSSKMSVPDALCKQAFADWMSMHEAEFKKRSGEPDNWFKLVQFVGMLIDEGVLDSDASERAISKTRSLTAKNAASARYQSHRQLKLWFQSAYREVRALLPGASRDTLITKVFEDDEIPSVAKAWAREADKEDGFVRKGGRPRRYE